MCLEAGAVVVDADGPRPRVADPDARRQLSPPAPRSCSQALHRGGAVVTVATSTSTALLAAADDAARAGGADRLATRFGGATQRPREGAGRLGERRRHRERARRSAAALAEAAPDIPFFGEEEGGERADVGWLVDPLDGTANFLHGFPVVGVSIALVVDGVPVVGVVHAPMLGDDVLAPARAAARPSTACRSRVSERAARAGDLRDRVPVPGARPSGSPSTSRCSSARSRTFEDLRRAGAASLDLAWTAAGVFDGYFEQALGPWDVAAGALLVREAGGVVTDWAGDDRAWLCVGRHRRRARRRARQHARDHPRVALTFRC